MGHSVFWLESPFLFQPFFIFEPPWFTQISLVCDDKCYAHPERYVFNCLLFKILCKKYWRNFKITCRESGRATME